MVDHLRTLLLNESAATANAIPGMAWRVDSSFAEIPLPAELKSFSDMLFSGVENNSERLARINEIMPFTADPEFRQSRLLFDLRETVPPRPSADTVFDFYLSFKGVSLSFVTRCVDAVSTPAVFSKIEGVASLFSGQLNVLKDVFLSSKETGKRFSACLFGYLIRVESLRVNALGGRGE